MFVCELTQDIKTLTGVGKKTREDYGNLGVSTIGDLISMTPKGYEDRSHRVCIGHQNDSDGTWTNTFVRAESVSEFGPGRKNVKIIVRDTENNQKAFLMGFNRTFLAKSVFPGCYYHLYANVVPYGTGLTSSQFELKPVREDSILLSNVGDLELNQGILPVYSLSGGLTQKTIRRDVKAALALAQGIDDELPQSLIAKYKLISLDQALREIHFPTSEKALKEARRALAFREVFYLQLETKRRPPVERKRKAIENRVYAAETRFVESLPFELTDDQKKVLSEIRQDMSGPESMNRLLQGDVGSGKTLVAWVSALHAICNGAQVAFMAPTELLARQHAQVADALFRDCGVTVAFLNGEVHGRPRQALLDQLKAGNIDLLIGTHALFSKDVVYRNLRYVIIDEQHRFGVEQRQALLEKGIEPDVLLMTATPIPRTLALTVFGNLNVSTIRTMPKGRLPIITYLVDDSKRDRMYQAVGVEMQRGHQAYFVYPRIDDEGNSDLRDVQTMYEFLSTQKYPSFKGALIHSRLPEEDKIAILNDFAAGKINYLVSTSVVEVGIDVPNATCMVVEHSENFGLSALHQLRGRVGRSSLQSWCFLAFEKNITEDGKKRLSVLHRTNDGFEIAEEDLKIRGPGELSGLRQSGFMHLKYADLEKDVSMMSTARDEVDSILAKDPGLISLDNAVIRKVLSLQK
ncbi:MAG: ATP-dependent DNA helicase RecG [Sphaerochaetaceae bacterium]|nr:ATP-dependent DNA helicase RecG [Sphaerochaetaceae bacterium]